MASKLCLQLFLLLAFISSHLISARHLHNYKSSRLLFPKHLEGSRKDDNIEGIHKVKAYLQRYGYLSYEEENNLNADTFDNVLESAIKSYQKFFRLNVSGVLDRETLQQMSLPRCGVTDNWKFQVSQQQDREKVQMNGSRYSFFPEPRAWPVQKKHLTYGFINNFPFEHIAAVLRAFDTWEHNTKFTFAQAPRVQSADILLSFERGDHGDGRPFDGKGGILAHAFGPIDGRIHFDADEEWNSGRIFAQFDVESVALHEIGHALGLGHSNIKQAVMWPNMDSGVKTRLTIDEIEGIRALYGA